jgi:hypothetical protein
MRTITKMEIAIGLVPVTLILTPLLTWGTGMLALVGILEFASWPQRIDELLGIGMLVLWGIAGLYGLLMVWIVTFESDSAIQLSYRQRTVRIVGLIAGAAAAAVFYWSMIKGASARNLIYWTLVFLGPTALGLKHGWRVFRGAERAE